MKVVKTRPADEGDLKALVALVDEYMPNEADAGGRLGALRQSLKHADYELLVADSDREVIGFIDGWIVDDFVHGGKLGHIQSLYVSTKYRRTGVGSRLVREMMRRAKAKGVLEMHVSTRFKNKPAIEFYKKRGFLEENLQLEMEL